MKVIGASGFLLAAPRTASAAEKQAARESAEKLPDAKPENSPKPRDPAENAGDPQPADEDPGYGIDGPGSGGGYIRVHGRRSSLEPEDRVELGCRE
ncbi:MAG: hypothetical protein HY319_14455 [Armatimonadetes bacterium]|nr:hypothetical protein [Armatimonadota bacterium]